MTIHNELRATYIGPLPKLRGFRAVIRPFPGARTWEIPRAVVAQFDSAPKGFSHLETGWHAFQMNSWRVDRYLELGEPVGGPDTDDQGRAAQPLGISRGSLTDEQDRWARGELVFDPATGKLLDKDQDIRDRRTRAARLEAHGEELLQALKDVTNALEPYVDTEARLRLPYEAPLSVYDRACDLITKIEGPGHG